MDPRQRGRAGGLAAAKSATRTYPLRKVIATDEFGDVLECGHRLTTAQDIMGPRYPERRRCRFCAREAAESVSQTQNSEEAGG